MTTLQHIKNRLNDVNLLDVNLFTGEKSDLVTPEYEALQLILSAAYLQASNGKGSERHGNQGDTPFHEQPMQRESDDIGSWDGLIFQARKKIREGIGLPTETAQVRELLGAINYLAGAIIWSLRQERHVSVQATEFNDNRFRDIKSSIRTVTNRESAALSSTLSALNPSPFAVQDGVVYLSEDDIARGYIRPGSLDK